MKSFYQVIGIGLMFSILFMHGTQSKLSASDTSAVIQEETRIVSQ